MSSFEWPSEGGGNAFTSIELDGATSGSVTITVPAVVSTYTLVLPGSQGGAGTTLVNDGSGGLTWQSAASITIGAFGSTPNANGLTLTGDVLNMQPADGTHPGGVSIAAQTLAGVKTFSSAPNLSSLTASLPLQLDASKNIAAAAINLSGSQITGILAATSFPAQTGDVTNSAGALANTISSNVVTNAKLAQMATLTIKGNNTGGTANAIDLTVSQVNTMLGSLSNPMTTLGDIIYEDATPVPTRLAGNTSATLAVLTQTGSGSVSAAPAWTTTTGTGSVARATAPTLSNPIVGTQSQGDASTKAASTAYVDTAVANAVAGINPAVAVQAATTAAGDTSGFTYNNGASGVGATFTGTTNVAVTVDGFTFTALNQRLLVKNDTQSPSGAFNGIYFVTQLQTGLLPPILTRALDYDAPSDMNNTGAIPVINGTVNGTTQWVLTSQVVTVGTTPLTYTKFSSNPATAGTVTSVTFTGDGTVLSSTPSSTVTTSGTVTGSLLTQSASKALFGPAFGASAATPTFRSPVLNDLSTTVQSKATTYAVLATDDEVICSGASWPATLPAANAAPAGKIFTFIHNDASLARQYTISRAGADTFQGGGTSTTIATQGEILKLQTDGTSVWYVVSRYYPETLLAYTPTVVGFGTITGGSFFYRRLGDSIEVRGSFTNGTVASALATITLPTGLVLDTTKISAANVTSTPGPTQGEWFNAGTNDFGSMVTATGTSTALVYFGSNTNTANNLLPNNGNTLAGSTTFTTTKFTVPIVGWSG